MKRQILFVLRFLETIRWDRAWSSGRRPCGKLLPGRRRRPEKGDCAKSRIEARALQSPRFVFEVLGKDRPRTLSLPTVSWQIVFTGGPPPKAPSSLLQG